MRGRGAQRACAPSLYEVAASGGSALGARRVQHARWKARAESGMKDAAAQRSALRWRSAARGARREGGERTARYGFPFLHVQHARVTRYHMHTVLVCYIRDEEVMFEADRYARLAWFMEARSGARPQRYQAEQCRIPGGVRGRRRFCYARCMAEPKVEGFAVGYRAASHAAPLPRLRQVCAMF